VTTPGNVMDWLVLATYEGPLVGLPLAAKVTGVAAAAATIIDLRATADQPPPGDEFATPTTISVVASVGTGPTELAAFDAALCSTGVANFNLVRLSSVIPSRSLITETDLAVTPDGNWGDRLYVVYATQTASTIGTEAWSGIGWSQEAVDGRGVFVEHEGPSESSVRADIQASLGSMIVGRPGDWSVPQMRVIGGEVLDSPICALVVAVFGASSWEGVSRDTGPDELAAAPAAIPAVDGPTDAIDVSTHEVLRGELADTLYSTYLAAFNPLRRRAATRHVMRADEWEAALTDPALTKVVARLNGEPLALAIVTDQPAAVDWLSTEFLVDRYPVEMAAGILWYVITTFVAPTVQGSRLFRALITALSDLVPPGGVIVTDLCQFNDDTRELGRVVASELGRQRRITGGLGEPIDVQSFYAFELDRFA
jgi:arginine decarboxylase